MKKHWILGAAAILSLTLTGCGNTEGDSKTSAKESEQVSKEATTQTISYLGTDYKVASPAKKIVTASLEAMEDAAMLGIKPTGALEIGGELPKYLAEDLAGAELIGNKMAPNAEAILALNPDVIVGTSKWNSDVLSEMNKIQTTLPYSHISTNWKENLMALAQIADKKELADKIISEYETKAKSAKEQVVSEIKDETILVIRVRGGLMYLYPAGVYLNPVLYEDLGATVPKIIADTKAQAEITMETLASINPDAIFLQFDESENAEAPAALENLQKDSVFSSLKASQNKRVFVNAIDPLAQGGTAWSKVKFLDVAVEKLLNK